MPTINKNLNVKSVSPQKQMHSVERELEAEETNTIKDLLESMEARLKSAVMDIKKDLQKDTSDVKKELKEVVEAMNFANQKFEEMKNEKRK